MMHRIAAVLIAGLFTTPAFAQAPPPIPALPDTERRTTYSITNSTCNCSVGMQLYGDSTDYANWITVWVNGVQVPQPGNWTLSVPTGSLSTNPRPISNAILTFTSAQTGTVQIVGARRPRRTSQVSESRGVAARDFNQIISDLEAQTRELWDRQARTIQAPPGDTLNTLPPAASRASQLYGFDGSGAAALYPLNSGAGGTVPVVANNETLANTSGVSATPIGKSLSAWFDSAVCSNVGSTIRRTLLGWACGNPDQFRPQDFGAVCDGVTNDTVAVQAAITGAVGKGLYIPPGPACAVTTLSLVSNTTITGADKQLSIIKGIGTGAIFSAVNVSNVTLRHFWCQGTDSATSWTSTNYGCFLFSQNGSATANGSDITIDNVKQSGFNTNYWNKIDLASSTYQLNNFTFTNNLIVSGAADIPTDPVPGNNGNTAISLLSGSGGHGRIETVRMNNNVIQGNGLCVGLNMYANIYKWDISNNLIESMGSITPDHCLSGDGFTNLSYAIIVYDYWSDGNPPKLGKVQNNEINSPTGTGIYFAGDGNLAHSALFYNNWESLISGNIVRGQLSDVDGSLPRAGIVVNAPGNVTISNNSVTGSFGGIAAAGQSSGDINIIGNTCAQAYSSALSLPYCIRLSAFPNSTANYVVRGNSLDNFGTASTSGAAMVMSSLTGSRFYTVDISNNTINGGWVGLSAANNFFTQSFTLNGNNFGGVSDNYKANISGLTGVPAVIMNNLFDAAGGANGNALVATSSTIHMANNKFANRTSGTAPMLISSGACGTVNGNTFSNVIQAARVASGSLGTVNPSTCTMNYLEFVQDFTTGEGGSPGSKYTNLGWLHVDTSPGTTHLPQHVLTGN